MHAEVFEDGTRGGDHLWQWRANKQQVLEHFLTQFFSLQAYSMFCTKFLLRMIK
jgi:hypothetical protein